MEAYAWLYINASIGNVLISADEVGGAAGQQS
jgi:hypothetical protein